MCNGLINNTALPFRNMGWTKRCSNFMKIYLVSLQKCLCYKISQKQTLREVMKNSSQNHNKIINSAEKIKMNFLMHGGNERSYTLELKTLRLFHLFFDRLVC